MAMNRPQIGIRHLFFAVLLTAIATSFIVLYIKRHQLEERAQSVAAFAARTDAEGWKLHVLRGLSVNSQSQRDAIQTLLTHWDTLEYRGGLWPNVDGRKLNTFLFTNAYPDGATVSVVVLMQDSKAVDAVAYVSNPETEQHACWEDIDDAEQYEFTILIYSPNAFQRVTKRLKWRLDSNGFANQKMTDRTRR